LGVSFARVIASGFGTGRVPAVAGTVASAVAALVGAALLQVSPLLLGFAAVLAIGGGVWAIRRAGVEGDPGWVTIDEFAGQFITLLGVSRVSATSVLVAFCLFRVLDITKLGPVGWADRRRGAFGIMADDVIAGAIGGVLLFGVRWAWPTLLG
jgi:phosphatidylglycerophosphatase A